MRATERCSREGRREAPREGAMSNIAGKAYAMNVITPVKPRWTWLQRLIFMAARAIPRSLGGLLRLFIIHFACWVIIKREGLPALGEPTPTNLGHHDVLLHRAFQGTSE